MRARSQRTHQMGVSNRNNETYDTKFNAKTVFERSFNKTKSLYYQPLQKTMPMMDACQKQTRTKPFLGSHNQFQSQRFDKMKIKPYKHQKMHIPRGVRELNLSSQLNTAIKSIQKDFLTSSTSINLHKLNELKLAFVKNNREKRDLRQYFSKFSNSEGVIDIGAFKKVVKQYGFDVNNQEAKLIFRMSNRDMLEGDEGKLEGLKINGFVELMTKDDIHYKTLRLNEPHAENPISQKRNTKHFSQKVHQILQNKFPLLKQALKTHTRRQEPITRQRYTQVMKRLDLTDLVLTENERSQIYERYEENGALNPEALICAIAEQYYGEKEGKDRFRDFSANVDANKEMEYEKEKKIRTQSLKNLSDLEYEKQLLRAQSVLQQLKKIKQEKSQSDLKIFGERNSIHRQELARKTEQFLQKEGINFQKDDYDAFTACFDFDVNGCISLKNAERTIFTESEKEARNRFERRTRNQMPKKNSEKIGNHMLTAAEEESYYDPEIAQKSLQKLKSHKMNPENRELFKFFDQDLDGYISEQEFKEKVSNLAILRKQEISNLSKYLGIEEKGGINFGDFTKKVSEREGKNSELPFVTASNGFRNSKSCYSNLSTFGNDKKNFIKTFNEPSYQCPTKYSAWPTRLTHTDFSMIQAPQNSAIHATKDERFSEKREDYGMKEKMKVQAVAESRRQRISNWNHTLNERVERTNELADQRQAARNYSMRLAQEKYQENCHK